MRDLGSHGPYCITESHANPSNMPHSRLHPIMHVVAGREKGEGEKGKREERENQRKRERRGGEKRERERETTGACRSASSNSARMFLSVSPERHDTTSGAESRRN